MVSMIHVNMPNLNALGSNSAKKRKPVYNYSKKENTLESLKTIPKAF